MIAILTKMPYFWINSLYYVINSIQSPISFRDRCRIIHDAEAALGETHLLSGACFLQAKWWRTGLGSDKKIKRETKLYEKDPICLIVFWWCGWGWDQAKNVWTNFCLYTKRCIEN